MNILCLLLHAYMIAQSAGTLDDSECAEQASLPLVFASAAAANQYVDCITPHKSACDFRKERNDPVTRNG